MIDTTPIRPGVINMFRANMAVQPEESVLIINDVPTLRDWEQRYPQLEDLNLRSLLARRIFDIARQELSGNCVDYLVFPSVGQHGAEPPANVAQQMLAYDVIVLATTFSLSHTRARENASQKGARIASMPGIETVMFLEGGPLAADYSAIRQDTHVLAEHLSAAKVARIITPEGTDITFSLEGRVGGEDHGILEKKGDWGNLPGGEAFAAPVEGTAQGRLVVPKGWYMDMEEDMVLEFRDGYVVSVSGGGHVGGEFLRLFAFGDGDFRHRRNCAELGIGTNPAAKKPNNVLEAEKIKGTVHVAIGDSSHLGGIQESDIHEDFILPNPTLYLDGKAVTLNKS